MNLQCPPPMINSSGGELAGTAMFWKQLLPELRTLEFLLAVAIFVVINSLRQKKRQGLPVWPVIGMFPSLVIGLRSNTYEWVTRILCSQGGTFEFKGPWFTSLNCVLTADPRNVEHLLKTKFPNFPKGEYFRYNLQDLLGGGIFNADDEVWRQQRKTSSVQFHSGEFRSLTATSLFHLVHFCLLPVLQDKISTNSAFDLQDVLLRLTFDNVCIIAFGVDPGCLRPGLPEIPFAQAFEDATEASTQRFVTPTSFWKVLRFLDVGIERKLRRSIKKVDEFADEVIRTRKKELELEGEKGSSRSDLLTVFMRLKDDEGKPFSAKFLRDICVNFILAGRDTSSVALAWFFWLVDKNPRVGERILNELDRIVKERGSSEERNIPVVFKPEEVKKMEYLQAALSETLRLYPSVPIDNKEVAEDDEFPDGTRLKKGTKIIYAVYAMGRMESIWGEDCLEFKPERWLREEKFVGESAYKFAAFNGGPRLCLGKDFAYYQMKYVAASILYHYSVKVVEKHIVIPKLSLTMYMKHGLKVTLSKRDGIFT